MCVILACVDRRPTFGELDRGQSRNPHGTGIAWINKDRKIEWTKKVNFCTEEVFDITESLELPFIVHFRLATVGGTCDELCHPFPVTEDVELNITGTANKVLFHNGHWNNWKQVMESLDLKLEGKVSDSRVLAKAYHRLAGPPNRQFNPYIGRVVTFDSDGFRLFPSENDWLTVSGIHYSNGSCMALQ